MWIGAKTRTDKLNLSQIQGVTWEPIASAPGYNILTIKAGATEKSNLYYYYVPNQVYLSSFSYLSCLPFLFSHISFAFSLPCLRANLVWFDLVW